MSSLRDQLSKGGSGGGNGSFVHYSPVGKFLYPKLNKPDVPKNADGTVKKTWKSTYQVTVAYSKDDQEAVEFFDTARVKDGNDELILLKDFKGKTFIKETEDEIHLMVRRLAEKGRPRFFIPDEDNPGKSIEIDAPNALIWSGTMGSVSFTTYNYDGGVGAGLCGVTIHELVGPPPKGVEEAPKEEPKKKGKSKAATGKKGETDLDEVFGK